MTERDMSRRPFLPVGDAGNYVGADRTAPVRTMWSGRWLRALGNWMSTSLLATGRLYVRRNQVTDLSVQPGSVTACVHEPDGRVCAVRLGLATFADDVWDRVIRLMAESISHSAHLLNGDMPRDIEDAFRTAGVGLFPERRGEVDADCDCPEWSPICHHVAAVLVLLADQLDEDPFLLLRLRGRTYEQVIASLRVARAALAHTPEAAGGQELKPGQASAEALSARLEDFWEMGSELDAVQIRVRPPEVDLEIVKLLGAPAFANDADLMEHLAEVYHTVSRRAMAMAYRASGEESIDEAENGGAPAG